MKSQILQKTNETHSGYYPEFVLFFFVSWVQFVCILGKVATRQLCFEIYWHIVSDHFDIKNWHWKLNVWTFWQVSITFIDKTCNIFLWERKFFAKNATLFFIPFLKTRKPIIPFCQIRPWRGWKSLLLVAPLRKPKSTCYYASKFPYSLS